jgi:hypothetical protein
MLLCWTAALALSTAAADQAAWEISTLCSNQTVSTVTGSTNNVLFTSGTLQMSALPPCLRTRQQHDPLDLLPQTVLACVPASFAVWLPCSSVYTKRLKQAWPRLSLQFVVKGDAIIDRSRTSKLYMGTTAGPSLWEIDLLTCRCAGRAHVPAT